MKHSILVVGDIIVDEFVWGSVARISPEAPVPVVDVDHIDRRLGGSTNVVRNLHALGVNVDMFGVVGDDEPGRWLLQNLQELKAGADGVVIKKNERPTAIKTRVVAHSQQVVRFDREWRGALQPGTQAKLRQRILEALPQAEAIILSDYGKGVLTPDFLSELMPELHGKIVAIDPKPQHADAYKGASLITPNLFEAAAMSGLEAVNTDARAEAMAKALHQRLELGLVLITRAEQGMTLFDGDRIHHIPTAARDVFDVTGAGDTVIAVFTACLARGDNPLAAAQYANRAAGVVIGKVGTATASWEEIENHSR